MTADRTIDPRMAEPLRDVEAEHRDLEPSGGAARRGAVAHPTPAEGWTIAPHVAHLAWTEKAMIIALLRPDQFVQFPSTLPSDAVDRAAEDGTSRGGPARLSRWRASWRTALEALARGPVGTRQVLRPLDERQDGGHSRVMEVRFHSQDIADALGVTRPPTPGCSTSARPVTGLLGCVRSSVQLPGWEI